MTKNMILATAAVGVMAFAGAASAHEITFRTSATPSDIDAADRNTSASPDGTTDTARYGRELNGLYLIANELSSTALSAGGVLALSDTLTSGSIPSGNNLYTISLTNATFSRAVSSTDVTGTNCTVGISSGGTSGSNTVTFLVSSSGAGNCSAFDLSVPVAPTGVGVVTVTTNLRTDNGAPIDGGIATFDAIFPIDAFQPAVNAVINTTTAAGAGGNTTTPIGTAPATPYTTLVDNNAVSPDGQLGQVAIYVDLRANKDLASTKVALADVVTAGVTLTGDFDAFDGAAGSVTLAGTAASTRTATNATFANNATTAGLIAEDLASRPTSANPVVVTADGGSIDTSAYSASLAYSLTAMTFTPQTAFDGNLESIEREGTNFIAPWVGGSQAQTQAVIRMSSTGAASGGVFVTLTNAYTSGNVPKADVQMCNLGIVPAAGDLVIGQPQLKACFGDFQRGDLLITVESAPEALTAKMRNITPNSTGGTFETTLGRYSGSTFAGAAQ